MIDKAHEKNLFLMEGMWSILFPVFYKLRELIAQDAIGEIRIVEADFGYQAATYGKDHKLTDYNPEGRMFSPALGGGGLMDVGVYPVSLSLS